MVWVLVDSGDAVVNLDAYHYVTADPTVMPQTEVEQESEVVGWQVVAHRTVPNASTDETFTLATFGQREQGRAKEMVVRIAQALKSGETLLDLTK